MKTYRRLETPKLWAVIKTQVCSDDGVLSDSTLTTPTTVQIAIEDSTGTLVTAVPAPNMTESATGKYYYAGYTIPSTANLGVWNYDVIATITSTVAIGRGSFMVEEQVA